MKFIITSSNDALHSDMELLRKAYPILDEYGLEKGLYVGNNPRKRVARRVNLPTITVEDLDSLKRLIDHLGNSVIVSMRAHIYGPYAPEDCDDFRLEETCWPMSHENALELQIYDACIE